MKCRALQRVRGLDCHEAASSPERECRLISTALLHEVKVGSKEVPTECSP